MRLVESIAVLYTTIAVCMDLNREKIDNPWIVFGWFVGFFYQLWKRGLKGTGIFLLGALVPVVILYLLFVFRMIGAGDIKLFSVLGGFMGPAAVAVCIGISFLFGAALSLAVLILCGNLKSRLRYFAGYFNRLITTKEIIPYLRKGRRMENIHFSVPILMSVLLFAGGFY